MRRNGPTRHVFIEDPEERDPLSRMQWCARCNLPANNAVHDLPQRTDEQRAAERRKVGDRD